MLDLIVNLVLGRRGLGDRPAGVGTRAGYMIFKL